MRLQSHHLELLSPARDAAIAREAILHGADAVYIGGPVHPQGEGGSHCLYQNRVFTLIYHVRPGSL